MKAPVRISVIVPSFNQGRFLDETLRSVLGQGYPDLELIVQDGGSTDNSVEVIRRHADRLAHWSSGPDGGQAAAINAGFTRATGDILCWLNSDDMHLPGTLAHAAAELDLGRAELLFGNCVHLTDGRHLVPGTVPPTTIAGSNVRAAHAGNPDLTLRDYVVQPSAFWTRQAWDRAGALDERLHFVFDWDWLIRGQRAGVTFRPTDRYLSIYRIHDAHKTGIGGRRRDEEIAELLDRHAGERYGRLFRECAQRRGLMRPLVAQLWRNRLGRLDVTALRLRFPRVFAGFRADEIRAVMSMV